MKYKGIDLFSGCGGLSLGASWGGIHIAAAVENDHDASETFIRNHPETQVFTQSIETLSPYTIKKNVFGNLRPFILIGGPPCQGYSASNCQSRNMGNKNNSMYLHFIKFVKVLNPQWILFENVEGLKNFEKGKILANIIENFRDLGYRVKMDVLNSADYGVPQKRKRLFIVGWKNKKIEFVFPKKRIEKDYITVEDALSDLPDLENGDAFPALKYKRYSGLSEYQKKMRNGNAETYNHFVSRNFDYVIERYKYIKQGENWESIPDRLFSNYKDRSRCHSSIYHRLRADQPSVVIGNFRKNMLIHPYSDRGLSVREAARLQSFPDDFVFSGFLNSQQQQVGNAVPPLLSEAIFKEILKRSETANSNE